MAVNDDLAELSELGEDEPMVCMKHLRFVPCRPCMVRAPNHGGLWNSSDPEDVEKVRQFQEGIAPE